MSKTILKLIFVTCTFVWMVGCGSITSNNPECASLAECNPDHACGKMIKCLDGKCQSDQIVDLPCEQECTNHANCPEDMHCRLETNEKGICVVDGACVDVQECLHLPYDDCLGSFQCKDDVCQYECLDVTSCEQSTDCVLADKGCCCGSLPEDYVAISKDSLSDWQNRPECKDVMCPAVFCMLPEGIQAACSTDGHCIVEKI